MAIHAPSRLYGDLTRDFIARIQAKNQEMADELDEGRRPWLSTELLEDIDLTTTETKVKHKLGKKPRGWWVVDSDAAATVRRSATADKDFLPLTASAAVTVSLLVF